MTTPVTQDNASPARPAVSGVTIWTLRLLAIAALGVALFLTASHLLIRFRLAHATVPFCSALPWFDCETVLNSDWATVFGIPVSGLASIVYAMVLALLAVPLGKVDRELAGRVWYLLSMLGVMIAGAAGWFIYLQTVRLGHLCSYCMTEHALGITLALLVWIHAAAAGGLRGVRLPLVVGIGGAAVGLLISGQLLDEPVYLAPQEPVVGRIDSMGNYKEPGNLATEVSLSQGWVVLNPRVHMMLGSARATHFIVEAVDYTCPHCRALYRMMKVVRPLIGPQYSIIVLTNPLSHHCNPALDSTDERHRDACALARLAQAVWTVDARKFGEFNDWLFENQGRITELTARQEAGRLVGDAALSACLATSAPTKLIKRDLEITRLLGVHQLPGLFAGKMKFNVLPEEPRVLADLLMRAFEGEGTQGPRDPGT